MVRRTQTQAGLVSAATVPPPIVEPVEPVAIAEPKVFGARLEGEGRKVSVEFKVRAALTGNHAEERRAIDNWQKSGRSPREAFENSAAKRLARICERAL